MTFSGGRTKIITKGDTIKDLLKISDYLKQVNADKYIIKDFNAVCEQIIDINLIK